MAWAWGKLTLNSLKMNVAESSNNNNNNNVVKAPEMALRPLPNHFFVRACKIAFPFLVLGNFAFAGYLMAKARQRDEAKGKQRDEAKATQGDNGIAKERDSAKAKELSTANNLLLTFESWKAPPVRVTSEVLSP